MRLRRNLELLAAHHFLKGLLHEPLDHLLPNRVLEALLDHSGGRLPRTESRKPHAGGVALRLLVLRVADRLYAVPLGSVIEITRAFESDIHRVDRHEVLNLRNETLTLVRLTGLSRRGRSAQKKVFVIVIALAERKFGLIVDRLVGEEELVIKALNDQLASTSMVSGASILGDGTVVLILNISSVVERLGRASLTSNPSKRAQEVSA